MSQPFNYMLNVPDPTQTVMGGVQNALNLSNMVAQRDAAAQKAIELQRAREAQAKMETDLGALSKNPTPAALAGMMVKYPSLSENFKRTYDVLSAEQKDSRISQASQVYAALQSGNSDVAINLLGEQATAYRNSGQEREAKTLEDLGSLIKNSPKTAETSAGLFLASAMGPEKFAETFTKLQGDRREQQLQPSKLTEAQANALKAATAAKFAESSAALDLQKKGWDITKIQEDIKIAKQNASIAAFNAQISKENNQLKREENQLKLQDTIQKREENQLKLQDMIQKREENQLKLQDMIQKRDSAVREKAADLESARGNIDNMLNTADRILATPIDVVGSAAGPISSRMPTTDQDTADLEELVSTLGSQAFLAQIPNIKGMGALSNAEGEKLTAALQNFSLRQSPERLLDNVREAQRLLSKARKNLTLRSGLPETTPDTPAAQTPAATIDELVKKYTQGVQ